MVNCFPYMGIRFAFFIHVETPTGVTRFKASLIGQSNGTSHFIQDKMFFRFVFLNIENLSIQLFKNGFSEMNLRTGVWTCIMKEVYAEFLIQKQASNSLFVLFT